MCSTAISEVGNTHATNKRSSHVEVWGPGEAESKSGLLKFIHEVILIRRSIHTPPINIGLDCLKTMSTHTALLSVAI